MADSHMLNVITVGEPEVGKTCLLVRFAEGEFPEKPLMTLGTQDYKSKQVELKGLEFSMKIWDTAGQERFKTITSSYYRGAHGVVIAVDITKKQSFDSVKDWVSEVEASALGNITKAVFLTKMDLRDDIAVKDEELEIYKNQWMGWDIALIEETSSKEGTGVDEAFAALGDRILTERPDLLKEAKLKETSLNLDAGPKEGKRRGGCFI